MIKDDSSFQRDSYITIDHFAASKTDEKKSVFYGWACPIASEQEAADLLKKAKDRYPDAKHHVYAWLLGGRMQLNKYSDDGEPMGTAGLPVFDVLRKNRIEDGMIIITRYFGGILLGGGGLVRAYTNAAVQALKEAQPVIMKSYMSYGSRMNYQDYEKIKRNLAEPDFYVDVTEYGAEINAVISCSADKKDALHTIIADISNGRASLEFKEKIYKKSGQVILS